VNPVRYPSVLLLLLCVLFQVTGSSRAWAAAEAGKAMLRGDSIAQHPMALDGEWHFFANRLIYPDQLAAESAGAAAVPVPSGWGSKLFPMQPKQGVGTYWLELVVGNTVTQPSALHFQRFCGASTIYFFADGKHAAKPLLELGKLGSTRVDEVIAGGDTLINLPTLKAGVYHLLVQQTNFHLWSGGLCGNVSIGQADVMAHSHEQRIVKSSVIITLLVSLALGSLLFGSQNGERAAPWLALLCGTATLLLICNTSLLDTLLPSGSPYLQQLRHGLYGISAMWMPTALLMVIRHTFTLPLPKALKIFSLGCPLLLIVMILAQAWMPVSSLRPYVALLIIGAWMMMLLIAAGALAIACRRRRQYAWIVAGACVPLAFTIPVDIYRFHVSGVIDIVSAYSITFLAVIYSGIYTLKFGTAYRLAARLSSHLQEEVDMRTRELREKNYKLEQTQIALQHANETLKHLSITDGLTRVYNRMYFEQQFEKEWRRCGRNALPLSVLMIDADHFKQLNDTAGHLVGDFCLQALAREIERHFKRSGELVARYGGEEFIVLLPDTNQHKALSSAEGLRTAIEHMPISYNTDPNDPRQFRVTVSIGVSTTVPSIDQQPSQLVATADAALYEAKDSGRNRVHSIPLMTGTRAATGQQPLHL